jgi:hypothetical protein
MKPIAVAALLLSPLFVVAEAQEKLVPVQGYFDSDSFTHKGFTEIRNTLLTGMDRDTFAVFIALESWGPNTATTLRKVDDRIVLATAHVEPKLSEGGWNEPQKVIRQEVAITPELAEVVQNVFYGATSRAAYSDTRKTGVFDGVEYYFVVSKPPHTPRAGRVFFPTRGTFTHRLAEFAKELRALPRQVDEVRRQAKTIDLITEGHELLKALSDANQSVDPTPESAPRNPGGSSGG